MNRILYSDISDLIWANAEHSAVNCTIHLIDHPIHGNEAHSFTAARSDPGWEHGEEIFEMAEAGQLGPIAEYVAPPQQVPETVTPLQARRALREAGLKEAVDSYVVTLSEEEREEWEYATVIERTHPVIVKAMAALGMSESDGDQLFIAASKK